MKRNEDKVSVTSPTGEIFEVPRRNANDLVEHLKWTYTNTLDIIDQNAAAPRDKKPRGSKVAEAKAKAAAEAAPTEAKKRGRPSKKAATPIDDDEDDEDVRPFDESFDAAAEDLEQQLDDLEAEEESRGKH